MSLLFSVCPSFIHQQETGSDNVQECDGGMAGGGAEQNQKQEANRKLHSRLYVYKMRVIMVTCSARCVVRSGAISDRAVHQLCQHR